MIKLSFKCNFDNNSGPFVGKVLRSDGRSVAGHAIKDAQIIGFYEHEVGGYSCKSSYGEFTIYCEKDYDFDGDVFLFIPEKKVAQRIIRRNSLDNTILFTERCDQLCVMCSQPPRLVDDSWLIPFYNEAIQLADDGVRIGISGGEPTLFKEELFSILENAATKRPDLSFHILSNAQHFLKEDRKRLKNIHNKLEVLWGIPLYSSSAQEHDEIVKKEAFHVLIENLYYLASAGGSIELRTVLMKKNILDLPHLAKFIVKNCNFIAFWAIMGLEPIGFAKSARDELFFDYSQFFAPVGKAIDIAKLHHMPVFLYNLPLCTVPKKYRTICVDSISDWKKKYLNICESCKEKENCSGFFEWYSSDWELSGIHPIN